MYVCVYYIHLMYRLYVHVLSIACFPYCILLLMLKSCKMCLYTITCMHVAFQQSLKNSLSLSPTLFSLLSSLSPFSLLLQDLFSYLSEEGISLTQYEVITTFPRTIVSLLPRDTTFRQAGLYPRQTVHVQLIDDE